MRSLGNKDQFDRVVLACDVGGTNTSIAGVGRLGRSFSILKRFRYESQKLPNLLDAICDARDALEREGNEPAKISICAAGPVRSGICELSNVPWNISQKEIEEKTSIPTLLMNDFTGVSYGIPLLDINDGSQIAQLPHPDGTLPPCKEGVRAVVGAGTGLGVGYVVEEGGKFFAFPSEGGHAAFSSSDQDDKALAAFVEKQWGTAPGWELFVSGRGIANTFAWIRDSLTTIPDLLRSVDTTGPGAAATIGKLAADGVEPAQEAMKRFVVNYGRFASGAALHFMPRAGLFLAGGIASKNLAWFRDDNRFMNAFLQSYRDNIRAFLRTIPVYVVLDYDISLYGAAHAAWAAESGG